MHFKSFDVNGMSWIFFSLPVFVLCACVCVCALVLQLTWYNHFQMESQPRICNDKLLHVLWMCTCVHSFSPSTSLSCCWFFLFIFNLLICMFHFPIAGLHQATRIYCHRVATETHCWRILVTCIWSRVLSCCGFMPATTKFGLYFMHVTTVDAMPLIVLYFAHFFANALRIFGNIVIEYSKSN